MADEKTPEEVEEAVAGDAAESKPAAEKPKRSRARRKPAAKKDAEKVEETASKKAAKSKPAAKAAKPDAAAKAKSKAKADSDESPAAEKPKRGRRKSAAAKTEAAKDDKPVAKAKPKPAAGETVGPPPVVRAQAKYVRTSARKARLVCDHIRGKSVEDARAILQYTPRHVARDWQKLLESAVANAEHNHELVGEDLRVVSVHADEGPTLKRFRPRAMGRATQIRKRTSHLSISLTPKEPR
jgi:ribosomal protein L22